MAEAISDRQIVTALRPFVRACSPILATLRDAEPKHAEPKHADRPQLPSGTATTSADLSTDVEDDPGLWAKLRAGLDSIKVPGTTAWTQMDAAGREDWWVNRVGRLTALVTAIPGLGGALADRLPVQDTLGAAAQGLLLCAIAGEHGVDDPADRVRLIAWVLFEREVSPEVAAGRHAEHDAGAEDEQTAELTEDITASRQRHGKVTLKACGRTLWRLGRSLLAITEELEKRPRGRFYHRILGMLPVVGMAGDYFGERSGLKRVRKRARQWLARPA